MQLFPSLGAREYALRAVGQYFVQFESLFNF